MPQVEIAHGTDRLQIDFIDEGEGYPVLLLHGFASTKEVNWLNTGWVKTLVAAGFRVLAIDNRGHGRSTKFHDISRYSLESMAHDALAFLDAMAVERSHVMGYSMGARIAITLAIRAPERVNRLVVSGNGWGMIEGSGDWNPVRDALLAESLTQVSDPRGRAFRAFAEQTGSDRLALAACVEGVRQLVDRNDLARVASRAMVAIGTQDDIAGSGEKLAAALPRAVYLPIPGRDHMNAVGDRAHLRGVLEFLTAVE